MLLVNIKHKYIQTYAHTNMVNVRLYADRIQI